MPFLEIFVSWAISLLHLMPLDQSGIVWVEGRFNEKQGEYAIVLGVDSSATNRDLLNLVFYKVKNRERITGELWIVDAHLAFEQQAKIIIAGGMKDAVLCNTRIARGEIAWGFCKGVLENANGESEDGEHVPGDAGRGEQGD